MHTISLVRKSLNPGLVIRGLLMTMYDGRTRLSQQVVDEGEALGQLRVLELAAQVHHREHRGHRDENGLTVSPTGWNTFQRPAASR